MGHPVTAEMAGRQAGRRGFLLAFSRSGAWRSLAAVAAVLLLVVGFAKVLQLGSLGRVVAIRTPTATEAQVSPLSWHPSPNQGLPRSSGLTTPALSDGNTAYACVVGGAAEQQVTVWVTHDLAAHWTRTGDLPPTGQTADATTQCDLMVDATDERRVVLTVYWHMTKAPNQPASMFVTMDGGATWQVLPISQPFTIAAMATYRGITYVLSLGGSNSPVVGLSASSDGLRTWHRIDQAIGAAFQTVTSFWLNPDSGEILAEGSGQGGSTAYLWDTSDGGRTWTQLAIQLPNPTFSIGNLAVQTPTAAGQPWHICDQYQNTDGPSFEANQLFCSTDGGVTWSARPTLNFPYTCSKCGGTPGTPTPEVSMMTPIALADDGALLVLVDVPQTSTPPLANPATISTLYRLPVGGSVWQSLGTEPDNVGNVVYCAGPGQGLLWSTALGFSTTFTAVYL